MNDDKYFKKCWHCGRSLRNHNPQYCEHIYNWKHYKCKPLWGFLHRKFHT